MNDTKKNSLGKMLEKFYPSSRNEYTFETVKEPVKCPYMPTALKISEGPFKKIHEYARLIPEVLRENFECYGFLLGNKNKDGIVTDAIFASNQEVSFSSVELNEDAVVESCKEIGKLNDRQVLGWWHSHGGLGTFHSGTDNNNIRTVLNSTMTFQKVRDIDVKFAYSLVVNSRGDNPYAEVMVQHSCGAAIRKTIPIEMYEGGDLGYNIELMKGEIKEKVKIPSWYHPGSLIDNIFRPKNYKTEDDGLVNKIKKVTDEKELKKQEEYTKRTYTEVSKIKKILCNKFKTKEDKDELRKV